MEDLLFGDLIEGLRQIAFMQQITLVGLGVIFVVMLVDIFSRRR